MKISPVDVWRNKEILYNLTGFSCRDCGFIGLPYYGICPRCKSKNIEKVSLAREGKLITYTVNFQIREGYEKIAPTYIGLIELDNGIRIIAPLTDVNPETIKEGVRVTATLRRFRSDSTTGIIVYGIKFKVEEDE
jgi:uncharacterized OB-fold protein